MKSPKSGITFHAFIIAISMNSIGFASEGKESTKILKKGQFILVEPYDQNKPEAAPNVHLIKCPSSEALITVINKNS